MPSPGCRDAASGDVITQTLRPPDHLQVTPATVLRPKLGEVMRLPFALTAASLVLVIMSAAACSNGSKTPAASAPSPSAANTSAPSAAGSAGATPAGGGAGNGASGVNVCALLTAAQASTIVGVTYTAGTPSFAAGGNSCTYASTAAPTPMTITVMANAGSAAAWTDELSTLKLGGGETPVTVSGLGDRAATSTDSLGTQAGTWIIQVDGGDQTSVGGVFTKSIAVAKAIIAALH
jgi:hypothetical protein